MEQLNKLFQPLKYLLWSDDTKKEVQDEFPGTNKTHFDTLLRHLELDSQKKLTVMDAMPVDRYTFSDEAIQSPNEIPKYIMRRLMIVDYGARTFSCKKERKRNTKICRKSAYRLDHNKHGGEEYEDEDNVDDEDDEDDEDEDNDSDNEVDDGEMTAIRAVNPMDAFLALIHCCDDFLRQDIANKLCTCQLSVPFLLPHPDRPSEEITMLLWALEGIKKTWKDLNRETGSLVDRQAFVTKHPFPIVSFVRVGENEISKSRLLNEVMSDINGYHDFFFHKNCEGGGVTRKIVDGLVELSWYLPGGKEKQAFEREICFANLRGDALCFRKQFSVLSRISSVILMLVPSESLDHAKKAFICEMINKEGKLILLFKKKRNAETRKFFDELKSYGKVCTIIKEMKENDHDFFKTIRSQIQKSLNEFSYTTSPKILEGVSDIAKNCGIIVDKQRDCWKMPSDWTAQATACFKGNPHDAKKLLKLQLHIPKIASLEREKFRQTSRRNREVQAYADHLHELMTKERELQERLLNEVEGAVNTCLCVYSTMTQIEQTFFLTSLKHEMDNLSLRILPSLQEEYQRICQVRFESKEDKDNLDNLKQLQKTIADSSFGLEHIVREMTQIFEVTSTNKADYAQIAAHMLLSGHPLELMDGDSLNVSLKWLYAVFNELKKSIGDANIFVISVLGIQSSGKSTMLNTMFGLQFAVSAGRCTRGAFASLIPVSDSLRQESNYEYLLIVDTEGLKGSSEKEMIQHDNELATFAIGTADLTIVNIFGENLSDIKEFLQIAVHAFLKMKLVQEKRMCQIIHQNVASTNASNQLASDRVSLKADLDKMTQLAAEAEKCEDECKEFSDVISFDQNDVSYIPSMLQGCPPMAPTSPEYGKSIQKVKEKIIALISSPDRVPISISKFQERVAILWKAILREDFIFSFRNTKEVRAKTSLDQKYFKESVLIITSEMTQQEMHITTMLKLSRPENRRELWRKMRGKIFSKAEALAAKMKEEMVGFFDTNEDKATLEQWRVNTMNKIDDLKRIRASEVENNCKTVYDLLENRQEIDKKKLTYKKVLLENAKECIMSIDEGEQESVYQEKFEEFWDVCLHEIPTTIIQRINVKQAMEAVLLTDNDKLLATMMERYNARNNDIVEFGKHVPRINLKMLQLSWWRKIPIGIANPQHVIDDANIIQDKIVDAALCFVKVRKLAGARCREADLQRMYHIIIDKLHDEIKDKKFKFLDELICDILLHCFGKVFPIFEEMEENYHRENDLKLYLEETLKPDLKSYFIAQCMKIKSELSAALSFVEALKRPIQSKLNQSMGSCVATELLNISEFQSKGQFHAKALLEMGEKDKFDAFTAYLTNPVKFLKKKLQMSINNYCIAQSESSIANLYKIEVKKIKSKILAAIQTTGNMHEGNEETGLNKWIDDFVQQCTMLTVEKDMFDMVTIHDELKDFKAFKEEVEKMLENIFDEIIDRAIDSSVISKWQPNPYDVLVGAMFGCDNCCPFCKALCDQTVKDHAGSHSTLNHRPQGIVGWHKISTKILVTSLCTSNVAGEGTFRNSDTCNNYHPYKQYQTVNDYYKSWSIPPDPSFEASSYWKWFMAKYPTKLAEHFKVQRPEIPSTWEKIRFNEAKDSIRNQYHV